MWDGWSGEWPDDERVSLDEMSLAQLDIGMVELFKDYYVGMSLLSLSLYLTFDLPFLSFIPHINSLSLSQSNWVCLLSVSKRSVVWCWMWVGSEEEREDVKKYYVECGGNILDVVEHLYFSSILTDEERVSGIVKDLIAKKELSPIPSNPLSAAQRTKRMNKVGHN